MSDHPFTSAFFQAHARRRRLPDSRSLLARIALDPNRFEQRRQQLASMFATLPEPTRTNEAFLRRITCVDRHDTFMGAFAEMSTFWILKEVGVEIGFGAVVGAKTPDLALLSPRQIPIEVFLLSQDAGDRDFSEGVRLVGEELANQTGPYSIIIHGDVSRPNGNVHGLGRAILNYLSRDFDRGEEVHRVTHRDATIYFRVFENDKADAPILVGGTGHVRTGDPYRDLLRRRLAKKLDSYDFPFLATCFCEAWPPGGALTFIHTMIGEEIHRIPIQLSGSSNTSSGEHRIVNRGNGFWGPSNQAMHDRHARIEGLLVIDLGSGDKGQFQFNIFFLDNPFSPKGWAEVLSAVPSWTTGTGYDSRVPGLKVAPPVGFF